MAVSDPIDLATQALDAVKDSPDAFLAVQLAQAWATVAVATELRSVRESIDSVTEALVDQDGFGVGLHLHYVSDWLKKIAER